MMSGSMNFLGGIKELVPVQSQREEIQELRNTISRVPKRVVVLLDEIDRMQRDELIVLLKILRGANTIPNVTFVCAFSEAEVKKQLERDGSLAHDYLEKFFPVSVTLSPPSPDLVGRCFRAELQGRLLQQGWFTDEEEVKPFATLLENAWDDGLAPVCTNLRKAGLLINDVLASGELITREVNPLDLVLVETIRRFAPSIHRTVRTHGVLLTDAEKSGYFDPEKDATEFFKQLNRDIEACPEAKTIKVLLCWLFPEYAEKGCDRRAQIMSASRRRVEPGAADGEKRIRDRYYFPIYFRAAVPEDMFSESELSQVLSKLKSAATNEATETVFRAELNSLPVGHPKRSDFLWKLARGAEGFKADAAERLAYVAAECASSYAYDVVNFGEAAYALNMVFVAAKLAADRQRVLEGAMARASNDTFAVRILDFTEHRDNNKILTDYSGIDIPKLKLAFIRRMQTRYGITSSTGPPDIGQADWWAFRQWVENSPEDTLAEQAFWSRFIGSSRKRLAQAANFIYPANVYWEQDPRPTVGALIPMAVLAQFLENRCSSDEELDPEENGALNRIQDLIAGKYRLGPHLGAALDQH